MIRAHLVGTALFLLSTALILACVPDGTYWLDSEPVRRTSGWEQMGLQGDVESMIVTSSSVRQSEGRRGIWHRGWTLYRFDEKGFLLSEEQRERGSNGIIDPFNTVTRTVYTHSLDSTIRSRYYKESLGGTRASSYDLFGNLLSVVITSHTETNKSDVTTMWRVLDSDGRVLEELRHNVVKVESLDHERRLESHVDRNTSYSYDSLGRVSNWQEIFKYGPMNGIYYDSIVQVRHISYDSLGRKVREIGSGSKHNDWPTFEYGYDSCGRLTKVLEFSSRASKGSFDSTITLFEYDDHGSLTWERSVWRSMSDSLRIFSYEDRHEYEYDGYGNWIVKSSTYDIGKPLEWHHVGHRIISYRGESKGTKPTMR